MKKVIVYFSEHCKDCGPLKAALDEAGIKYAAVDISSGMFPLKQFLKYRDHRAEFDPIKEKGQVGVPCIVVNDGEQILFSVPEDLDILR
ncbi:MAG: hypothetical protein IJO51_01140 [Clostridia bacterium]|nr:hypothetical protein [Clostridia bacterium]MBQ9924604.1 hypothetical protein [Clostridia bacterium]